MRVEELKLRLQRTEITQLKSEVAILFIGAVYSPYRFKVFLEEEGIEFSEKYIANKKTANGKVRGVTEFKIKLTDVKSNPKLSEHISLTKQPA